MNLGDETAFFRQIDKKYNWLIKIIAANILCVKPKSIENLRFHVYKKHGSGDQEKS